MIARRFDSHCRFLPGRSVLFVLTTLSVLAPAALPAAPQIFTKQASTTFAPAIGTTLQKNSEHGGLAFVDLNNDGYLDVVIVNDNLTEPTILKNLGPSTGGVYQFQLEALALDPDPNSGYYPSGYVVVGDYDNDYDNDLFFSDDKTGTGGWLYENNLRDNGFGTSPPGNSGAFVFSLVTEAVGLDVAPDYTNGVVLADIDADADLDIIYDDPVGKKKLFINLRNAGLMEFQADSTSNPKLVDSVSGGGELSMVDFDLDGYPDLMSRASPDPNTNADVIYRNSGGAFQDAIFTQQVGISSALGPMTFVATDMGTSTGWADYDNDGDYDILIQNRSVTQGGSNYASRFFVGAWSSTSNPKFTFTDRNTTADIGVTFPSYSAPADYGGGVVWGDLNNDGLPDVYFGSPRLDEADKVYLGAGGGKFTDQTSAETAISASSGGTRGDTEAVALADWDNDGDLDLYINNDTAEDVIFINGTSSTSTKSNFLRVRATCSAVKRDCIGATVQVFKAGDSGSDKVPDAYRPGYPGAPTVNGVNYGSLSNAVESGRLVGMRMVSGGAGIGAQSPFILHFGLSDPSAYYTVRVLFPGGKVVLKDVQPSSLSGSFNGRTLSQFIAIDQNDASDDGDGLPSSLEPAVTSAGIDLDSDDDGLMDSDEVWKYGTDPAKFDTDGDSISDGIELGETSGVTDMDGSGPLLATNASVFKDDKDSSSKTDPKKKDSDGDLLDDGVEDKNFNGRYDAQLTGGQEETDALDVDTDDDGIFDGWEIFGYPCDSTKSSTCFTCTGTGPSRQCTTVTKYYSNPRNPNTDADGLFDGLEVGLQESMDVTYPPASGVKGTNVGAGVFRADSEDKGAKTTDPNNGDTDADKLQDGNEDKNSNGAWEPNSSLKETDPTQYSSDGACGGNGDGDGDEYNALPPTDPLNPNDDTCADPDGDGCDNAREASIGTDPSNADSDGDTLTDCLEYSNGYNPKSTDTDGDQIPDNIEDYNKNYSQDPGETNPKDEDTDGDNIPDGKEDRAPYRSVDSGETNPLDIDSDDDGVADGSEDANMNGVWEVGETKGYDHDTDADGLPDGLELGITTPTSQTLLSAGHFTADSDPSSTTDPKKADTDGDRLIDGPTQSTTLGEDQNADGKVDSGETDPNKKDTDGDGCQDGFELLDVNPPSNPTLEDTDGDGLTDCEEVNTYGTSPTDDDTDGDQISDFDEVEGTHGHVTDPDKADTDGDGLTDGQEVFTHGSDPTQVDTDGDTLSDGAEVLHATESTSPTEVDTDGDGIRDDVEVKSGCLLDARNPDTDNDQLQDGQESADFDCTTDFGESNPLDDDTDDDGILDGNEVNTLHTSPLEADTDKDGVKDGTEIGLTAPQGEDTNLATFVVDADPASKTDPLEADTDQDGLMDGQEDKNANGAREAGETDPRDDDTDDDDLLDGEEGTHGTDPLNPDTDGGCELDGAEIKNHTPPNDPVDNPDDDDCADADNDGISNSNELLFHSDPEDADTDDDGVLDGDEPGLNESRNGWSDNNGDGLVDASDGDVDGDGLNSILDPDSDNDGILDATEQGVYEVNTQLNPDGGDPTDLSRNRYVPDADKGATRTDANNPDTDGGGADDGAEDWNHDGRVDGNAGELNPNLPTDDPSPSNPGGGAPCEADSPVQDSDCDGLTDAEEIAQNAGKADWVDPFDRDSDDDGVLDGEEDNWSVDMDGDGLKDVRDVDSDNDGLLDGTEKGISEVSEDTDEAKGFFLPDLDPTTQTSMVNRDTDFGGTDDGAEDPNHDGAQDESEVPETSELDPADPEDDLGRSASDDLGRYATSFNCELDTVVQDSDCDGLTDLEEQHEGTNGGDADSDDDGMKDGLEDNWTVDTDDDGSIDAQDCDSDGDQVFDGVERGVTSPVGSSGNGTNQGTGCYLPDADSSTTTVMIDHDTDGGLVPDGTEDANHNGKLEPTGGETDPNDPGDDCDDSDEDGLCNADEEAAGTDPTDRDSDDDGVTDSEEGTRSSPWNDDRDTDGLINALDPDSDNDGVLDGTEMGVTENEIVIAAKPDDNGTYKTYGFFIADADPETTTDPTNPDTDGDGIDDGAADPNHNGKADDTLKTGITSCPQGASKLPDSDCDGLTDDEETHQQSIGRQVAPDDADSDDDGVLDGEEHNWSVDMDHDGTIDALDTDSDSDRVLDGTEFGKTRTSIVVDEGGARGGTDLSRGAFVEDADEGETTTWMIVADSDGDGFVEGDEDCDANGAVNCVESDPNDSSDPESGTTESICYDADQDGLTNYVELQLGTEVDNPDSDGDHISDLIEVGGDACSLTARDTDQDGSSDAEDRDSDNDGLEDCYEAYPDTEACTNPDFVPDGDPEDADGDGLANYIDSDSDGDDLSDNDEEDVYGTDPYDPDTDDGGANDGQEVLVDHTSPWVALDDNTGLRGGGCSTQGRNGSSSGIATLALALAAMTPSLRRRRAARRSIFGGLLGLVLVGSILAGAQPAQAQTTVDRFSAQTFRPALDMGSYITVWDSEVLRQWNFNAGLSVNYAHHPLVQRSLADGEVKQTIMDRLLTGELYGGVGLTNFVSVHLSLPVSLGSGVAPVMLSEDILIPTGYEAIPSFGLGDAWLAAKLQILNPRKSAIGLAAIPEFSVPIGQTDSFYNERRPSFRLRVAAETDLKFLRVGVNAGYRLRPRVQVLDVLLEDTVEYGAAAKIPIIAGLDLSAELVGSVVARSFKSESFNPDMALERRGTSPLEMLLAAHYVTDMGLIATLGGGVGLTNGVGTPTFRAFAGFGYRSPLNLDEDGDGIPDRFDKCPKDPENFNGVMDEDGCPEPDTDSDGIVDPVDACPTAPEDFDGFQDEDGCPDLDNDGDGIPDAKDQCPNEPEDKDGFEDNDGCPDMDNDRDGIPDDKDKCSNQAEDFDGFQDDDGCPDADNDSDGLPDAIDRCPNEPEDKDGFEDEDGCPDTDNDNDGILDADDGCPNEPEVINSVDDEDGCPDEGTQLVFVKEDRLVILFPVHFEVNRAVIRADSETLLNQVATTLKMNPYIKKIRIEGHTDSDGNDDANLKLSQARAESVMDYLIKQGVDSARLEAVGYGETRPIASNKTTAGKEKNRRVDFIIVEREERIKLQKKKSTSEDAPGTQPPK